MECINSISYDFYKKKKSKFIGRGEVKSAGGEDYSVLVFEFQDNFVKK